MEVQSSPVSIASPVVDPDPPHIDPHGASKKAFSDRYTPQTRLLVALGIALGTLAVSAFLAYSMTEFRRRRPVDAKQLIAGVMRACLSPQCRQALSFINLSLDTRADPCQDAYAMACGRWSQVNDVAVPLSYTQRLFSNYMTMVHRQLTATGSTRLNNLPHIAVPARIYASCIAFFHDARTRIADVWEATGINVTRWLAVRNFAELFSLMVHAVVASRFDSSFAIGHRIDGNFSSALLSVRTGRSLNTAVVATRAREELIRESGRALLSLEAAKDEVKAEDIICLDDALEHLTKAFAETEAETLVVSAELDDPAHGVNWAPVLQSAVDAAQLTWKAPLERPIKRLFANDVTALRSVVALLGEAELKTAVHYALLVPVAEYMSLEYNVSGERSRAPFSTRRRTCLGGLQVLLGAGFLSALGGFFGAQDAIKLAADMWSSIRGQLASMRSIAPGVELDEAILRGLSMVAEGANGSSWNTTFGAHGDLYGDGFIVNLALHARLADRRVAARAMLEAKPRGTGMIPTAYMLPDFFYPGVTESSVNYATLGTHMGKRLFDASLTRALPAKHERCFADYAREHLHLDANGAALLKFLRSRWAVEAALAAWKEERGRMTTYAPMVQLFFLRVAVVHCGEPEQRRGPLLFATRTSPGYARAFGCPDPPPLPYC
ncbi:uncharacterized protein LOC144162219 [Haemaphysalis longicornis]